MNSKYVTSLELCRQLKEAGWKKETEFWWVAWDENYPHSFNLSFQPSKTISCGLNKIPAPLSDEILEELPKEIEGNVLVISREELDKNYWGWLVEYSGAKHCEMDVSVVNTLALIWIYLKKEGLIK